MGLLALRGSLSRRQTLLLTSGGLALLLAVWHILTMGSAPMLTPAILPSPWRVITAYGDLYRDNDIIRNTCRSVGINLAGYLEAVGIALPLGFLIGLIPLFRGGFQRQVEALRYIPLTAVTGLFIVWFGVGAGMKVHFLAFGILIYLLPVIIQRIDEVQDVFLRTVYTLGASPWQTIRTVYWPSVSSRIIDDIRVLTAISWTYIIVAENIDSSQGGIGALIWRVGQRQGRMDKVFALLILIILIGVLQDRLFKRADRVLFPFKGEEAAHGRKPVESSHLGRIIWQFSRAAIWWSLLAAYWLLAINEWTGVFFPVRLFDHLFGATAWSVHVVMFLLTAFQLWTLREKKLDRYGRQKTSSATS
jgi:NitT/TauT family transport system permease protein